MSAINSITSDKLARLIGTPSCPAIIDVRPEGTELLPASSRRHAESVGEWASELTDRKVVIACVHGQERSAGVAAILRSEGVDALRERNDARLAGMRPRQWRDYPAQVGVDCVLQRDRNGSLGLRGQLGTSRQDEGARHDQWPDGTPESTDGTVHHAPCSSRRSQASRFAHAAQRELAPNMKLDTLIPPKKSSS